MKIGTGIAVLALLAGVASAAPIRVQESAVGGGSYLLNPGDLSAGVFGAVSPNFTGGALGFVHAALAADSINTNNIVTILSAQTDDGQALFALMDKPVGAFGAFNARLDVVGVAKDNNGDGIVGWVNDNGGELIQMASFNPIAQTYNFDTTFRWDANTEGDAFALSQLGTGDDGSFVFNPLQGTGLTGVARGFQYVSYNNGHWVVVGTGSFNGGPNGASTSLDWRVIPLPSAGAMSLAGLALVGARRRRAL